MGAWSTSSRFISIDSLAPHASCVFFSFTSIFGGTADSVALWFKFIGHESWFYYYLTAMIGVSLVVYLFMRDTRADSAMHRHE